jgi:hypothetical protein
VCALCERACEQQHQEKELDRWQAGQLCGSHPRHRGRSSDGGVVLKDGG